MALYVTAAGWIAGLWYAARWDSPSVIYLAGALLALCALLVGRADRRLVLSSVFLLALTLGAVRMDRAFSGDLLHSVRGGSVGVLGVVAEQRARGVYLVDAREPAEGVVLVYSPGSKLRAGDLVRVRGSVVPDEHLEPYERGLARSTGAALVLRRPNVQLLDFNQADPFSRTLSELRAHVSVLLERHLPRSLSPVAEGLLLGGSVRMDPDIRRAFRESGTSHILAASGYNITVLAAMMLVLLRPLLGARHALPPVLLAIVVYAGLAGFSASVVRAALMGAVTVGGMWLGRPRDSGRALGAAAVVMTLIQPHALFDIGAQLSFVATAGLLWLYPIVRRTLGRMWRPLADAVGIALTAQVSTLPLSLYYFGGLSIWAVVANVIIAPLVPVGMMLSGLTLLAGMLWYPLGEVIGWVAGAVLGANVGVAQAVSEMPGSRLQTDRLPLSPVVLYYALLILSLWLPTRVPRRLRFMLGEAAG